MNLRLVTGICLLFAWPGWCMAAEDTDPPRPVYRFLVMVETSDSMVRQKDVALDTIHELILTAFYNRIQRGDVLGIWTFKDEVNQKFIRPIHWSAVEARDLSNFVYRKLRDIEFSGKSELVMALAAAKEEARRGEQLTVFVVSSGEELVQGTPFDGEINSVFQQHGVAMAKSKRPFVTVLVFENGQVAAQAVTPGGRTIYIPATPSSTARAAVEPALTVPQPTADSPAPEPAARPEPMSVEEIAAKLRVAQAQKIANGAGQLPVEAGVVPEPAADPAPAALPDPVPSEEPAERADLVVSEDRTEAGPSLTPEAVTEVPMVRVEPEQERVEPMVEAVEPPREVAPGTPGVSEEESDAKASKEEVVAPETLQEAGVAPPEDVHPDAVVDFQDPENADSAAQGLVLPSGGGGGGRMFYLAVGVGLSALAVFLILWRLWRTRRRGRASVISQSMYRK